MANIISVCVGAERHHDPVAAAVDAFEVPGAAVSATAGSVEFELDESSEPHAAVIRASRRRPRSVVG
jgi:hypothetical protein